MMVYWVSTAYRKFRFQIHVYYYVSSVHSSHIYFLIIVLLSLTSYHPHTYRGMRSVGMRKG